MHPLLALPIGLCCIAAAWWTNRRLVGFLPDDLPRPGRKQHTRPVPLAGIALLPAVLLWLALGSQWVLLGAAIATTALGFVDDWYKELGRDLDWRIKFLVLALAAAAVATMAVDPLREPLMFAGVVALVFVLTNAINFLDNTDGVAATVAGVGLLIADGGKGTWAPIGWTALAFVPWNWPRPGLFLGDSGAYLLGICVGAACVTTSSDHLLWAPFAIPLVDFTQVVCARLWLGLRPWVGDRRHLTHIAQNLGLPTIWVAPLFALLVLVAAQLAD